MTAFQRGFYAFFQRNSKDYAFSAWLEAVVTKVGSSTSHLRITTLQLTSSFNSLRGSDHWYRHLKSGYTSTQPHRTMPIHGIAALLEGRVNYGYAVTAVILVVLAATLKAWAGGRKNTWERDWAGKMILVIVSTDPSLLFLSRSTRIYLLCALHALL